MRFHSNDILSILLGLLLIGSGLTVFVGLYLVFWTDRKELGWILVVLGSILFFLVALLVS